VRAFTHRASVGVNFQLETRIAAEPGGAAVMATLLSGAYRPRRDERVGIVICGGNTDAVTLVIMRRENGS